MNSELIFQLALFTSITGLIVSMILYLVNRIESFHARLLAFSLFTISISCLGYGFYFSNIYVDHPHLWRSPVFLTLCTQPVSYLYIRSVINQEYKLRPSDVWFLMPAVFYTLNYLPFYLLTRNEKLFFIKQALKDTSLIANELETWIKIPGAVLIRLGYGVTLLSMGLIHIHKWKRSFQDQKFQNQNVDVYRWLLFYTIILFSAYVFLFVEYIFHFFQVTEAYALFTLTVSVTIILICIYLLIRPNILYGARGWNPKLNPDSLNSLPKDQTLMENRNRYSISYEQGLMYKRMLEEHLYTHKPFQKQGYSIRDLSLELKIPTYQLSVFINQEYSKNFNELINEHRIRFLKSLLDEEDKYRKYTLDALSKFGGFNSRSSFIAAVKRYAGQTPSDFFSRS